MVVMAIAPTGHAHLLIVAARREVAGTLGTEEVCGTDGESRELSIWGVLWGVLRRASRLTLERTSTRSTLPSLAAR